jgi:pimeloyl-ACP methyl ester carboxylesterase
MEEEGWAEALDGHKVRYTRREVRDPSGTVVMCHGIEMDRDEWNGFYSQVAEELAEKGFSSIRFDFRGHGESEMDGLDFSVSGMVMDLEAVLKEGDELHVLAASFGAIPAILCAEEHDLESLTLLCPLIDTHKNYFEPSGDSFVDRNRDELEEKGFITRPSGYRMSAQLLFELRSIRPEKVLENLETPVLTVQGADDSAVPPEISRKYGSPNQNSKYVEVEDADHGLVDPGDEGLGKGTKKNWRKFEEELIGFLE